MEQNTWIQEMGDYAEIQLEVSKRELDDMLERAFLTAPWMREEDPHDWAEEYHRDRHNEDRDQ